MDKTAIVRDPLYLKHSNGPRHPEAPERLLAIDAMLTRFPWKEQVEDIPARDATLEELAWIHEERYIRLIEKTRESSFTVLDPDTSATADSYAAAVRAAGGTMAAAEAVLTGRYPSAFALVRPPGHHAEAGRAMGFCLFNNIAVAAACALHRHRLQRVLIVDWDVHHGNGTMHSFYDTGKVLYFSVHQFPHYPGTGRIEEIGRGEGLGFTVNVPLYGGQGDGDYLFIFDRILAPICREYRPELILVSAGFDAHCNDPLAGMRVSSEGYSALAAALRGLADECCPGRLAFTMEGGYDHIALTEGIAGVLRVLIGGSGERQNIAEDPREDTRQVAEGVLRVFSPYWKSL